MGGMDGPDEFDLLARSEELRGEVRHRLALHCGLMKRRRDLVQQHRDLVADLHVVMGHVEQTAKVLGWSR